VSRRDSKRQQVGYSAVLKEKWSSIDFQRLVDRVTSSWQALPKLHRRLLVILVPIVVLLSVIPWPDPSQEISSAESQVQRVALQLDIKDGESEFPSKRQSQASQRQKTWINYTVQNGDTLSKFFRRNNLSMSDLNALIKIEGVDKPLSNIQPGQLIRYKLTAKGQLDILQLEQKNNSVMFFRMSDGGFGRSQ
jgi:cell envelope opacity-associated protein A